MNIQFIETAKVNSIIEDINWNIPHVLSIFSPQNFENILKINLSFDNTTTDKLIWTRYENDDLSFKDAYNCILMDSIEPS